MVEIYIGSGIIALIFLIFQMVVLAVIIDIGSGAIARPGGLTTYTAVAKENPANETGKITSVEIWSLDELTNVVVATFFVVSGDNLTTRDNVAIGTVQPGEKRTFPVNLDVESGDYLGIYFVGSIEAHTAGGTGIWYKAGNNIPCENLGFGSIADYEISIYGTGTTEVAVKKKNVIFMGSNF